ncbi:MAG TPA: alpha/beta fold hydrolase [Vicinamibacterales bacterium]
MMIPLMLTLTLVLSLSPAGQAPQAAHGSHGSVEAAAKAPLLTGLGDWRHPVSTRVARAQQFFDQGLRLFYAFNFEESARAFREAARLDPSLAMAYWGEAMALGPNLNAPMPVEDGRRAYAAAREAARRAAGATPKEQAYIAALQTRFAEDGAGDRAGLDAAFAEAAARVAAQFPDDADAVTIAAAAFMQTIAWDYWLPDGSPKPGVEALMATLERTAARFPNHAGAHHFFIHLVEASDAYVGRAEKSADLLTPLMPAAGHLVHMPAHIYLRIGRYADAYRVNELASLADEDYIAQCRAQGVYPVAYYPHNLHFLWAAATIEGRGALAIAHARKVAAKVPHHLAGHLSWTYEFPVVPIFALVRFGQWSDILSEPKPHDAGTPYPEAMWRYARALARVARGEVDKARLELAAMERLRADASFTTTLAATALPSNFDIALEEVRAAIGFRAGDVDAALAAAARGVALQDAQPYSEPALWHRPVRLMLGQMLFESGRFAEAEAVYREELRRLRENGWGLFGLWQSVLAQGRVDEARELRARFDKAWARADVLLTSTSMLPVRSSAPSETFVDLPTGVRLEYVEQGDPSGVPVIFLHGITDSWRSFEPVLRHLPRSVRAFAISLRGHGDSTRPEAGYSPIEMAADVAAFMDAMRLPDAVIVGHSMGAGVAQRFVADYRGRASAFALMGGFATMHRDPAMTEFVTTSIVPLSDPIGRGFARDWQLSTLARPVPPDFLETVIDETLKIPARVWQAAFQAMVSTPDALEALPAADVPSLLLWGSRDAFAPREAQDLFRARLPRSRLIVYEGAGHGFHWEDPARVAQDLAGFLVGEVVAARPGTR